MAFFQHLRLPPPDLVCVSWFHLFNSQPANQINATSSDNNLVYTQSLAFATTRSSYSGGLLQLNSCQTRLNLIGGGANQRKYSTGRPYKKSFFQSTSISQFKVADHCVLLKSGCRVERFTIL